MNPMANAPEVPMTRQVFGWLKLLAILIVASLVMMLVGCAEVHAADAAPPAGADEAGPAAPVADPAEAAVPLAAARPPRRKANSLDIIFGFQGSLQDNIDVPTATEKWKIGGGGSSWLGYRRDIGDGLVSFGGKIGLRGIGLTQENSTTNLDFHHVIQSVFLMPNLRLSVPLGSHKALWFIDAGFGAGFHQFILDGDAPNGTPRPTIATTVAFDVMSGFMFCVYDGDARLDIGFNLDFLGAEGRIKKLYPAGTPAADKFKNFNLGHAGLDFNMSVKF